MRFMVVWWWCVFGEVGYTLCVCGGEGGEGGGGRGGRG